MICFFPIVCGSVQFSRSVLYYFLWPMDCRTSAFPVDHQLPEFTQTHAHWISDAVQPTYPLSSPSSLASNLSQHQGLFQWVRCSHQVAEVLAFSFSISAYNEYSVLISFRMDWLDLLAGQRVLKSLLQHHNSKASILQCSAFFIVQLSHPYMTTGKPYPWLDKLLLEK